MVELEGKTALVTGGARRLGAAIARQLHSAGMRVAIHYRGSEADARALAGELNALRPESVSLHQEDLSNTAGLQPLVEAAAAQHGGLHVLVNNASSFYPTEVSDVTEDQWNDLMTSNLKAPFFLAQAAYPHLARSEGCILNMADIYGSHPLRGFSVYCMAKAGLVMLTKSLANEFGPKVRVNAIAPGPILKPNTGDEDGAGDEAGTPATVLERWGKASEIAAAALFLVRDATFTSGTVLPVDGGRASYGF